MKRTFAVGFAATFLLCGCATTSFAPPSVRLDRELTFTREQSSFNAVCTPNSSNTNHLIDRGVEGALKLINNYILTYRCQAHRAAEGRQFFEIPGFLVAAGAATAAAFGAPAGVAIGAGAGGAVLSQGKSYYAPQQKAAVLSQALDAFLCIKTTAVGLDPFTLDAITGVQEAGKDTGNGVQPAVGAAALATGNGDDAGPTISVSAGEQYFDLIQAALFSVELITAQRLAAARTPFDSASVIAEIESLKEKAQPTPAQTTQADSAASALQSASSQLANMASMRTATQAQQALSASQKLNSLSRESLSATIVQLKVLQPKLQQCVVRAKI